MERDLEILHFKNPYFVSSLAVFWIQLLLFLSVERDKIDFSSEVIFSNKRYLIIHISVVIGGMFFIWSKIFSTAFKISDSWNILLMAIPFLIIRAVFNSGFKFKPPHFKK